MDIIQKILNNELMLDEILDDLESSVNRAKNAVWGRWKMYNPQATDEEHDEEVRQSVYEICKITNPLNEKIACLTFEKFKELLCDTYGIIEKESTLYDIFQSYVDEN